MAKRLDNEAAPAPQAPAPVSPAPQAPASEPVPAPAADDGSQARRGPRRPLRASNAPLGTRNLCVGGTGLLRCPMAGAGLTAWPSANGWGSYETEERPRARGATAFALVGRAGACGLRGGAGTRAEDAGRVRARPVRSGAGGAVDLLQRHAAAGFRRPRQGLQCDERQGSRHRGDQLQPRRRQRPGLRCHRFRAGALWVRGRCPTRSCRIPIRRRS